MTQTATKPNISAGNRIYYTGDIANQSAWGTVCCITPFDVHLTMDDYSDMHIPPSNIGHVYQGHCFPRFVTETAYKAFYAQFHRTLLLDGSSFVEKKVENGR